jgi:hypothetical protein
VPLDHDFLLLVDDRCIEEAFAPSVVKESVEDIDDSAVTTMEQAMHNHQYPEQSQWYVENMFHTPHFQAENADSLHGDSLPLQAYNLSVPLDHDFLLLDDDRCIEEALHVLMTNGVSSQAGSIAFEQLTYTVHQKGVTTKACSMAFQDLIRVEPDLASMLHSRVSSLAFDSFGNFAVSAVVDLPWWHWPKWEFVAREILDFGVVKFATDERGVRVVRNILKQYYHKPQIHQATPVGQVAREVKYEIKNICGIGFGNVVAEILYEHDSKETRDTIARWTLRKEAVKGLSRPCGNDFANQHALLLSNIFVADQHGFHSRALFADIIKVEGLLGKIAKRKGSKDCMDTIVRMVENNQISSKDSKKVRAELAQASDLFVKRGKVNAYGCRQGMQLEVVREMLARLDACMEHFCYQ